VLDAWSAAERREGDRENRTTSITFVNELSLMLAHDCLLYERSRAPTANSGLTIPLGKTTQEGGRMTQKTSRQVVEHFVEALIARDLDRQAEVCAQDMVIEYPQSGERIRGWSNIRAVAENYPGGLPQDLAGKVVGSEDKWVVGPSFNVLRIEGTGDTYTLVGSATYPDGKTWQLMSLVELRSGKIAKTIDVYGAPFDPPAWRSKWVERTT
jgi:hypothetical protein